MRNVRFQLTVQQWSLITAGVVAVAGVALLVNRPATKPVSAVQVEQSSATSGSEQNQESKHVYVNGREVPTDEDGTTTMTVPGQPKTTVEVKDGTTTVKTEEPQQTTQSNSTSSNGSMNVSMTTKNSGGRSYGSTNVFGSSFNSTSNGSSQSFSTTQVFSTDTANVSVNP